MLRIFHRFNRSLNNEVIRADIHSILIDLKPENAFELRIEALRKLIDWTKYPVTVGDETKDDFASRTLRTKFLLNFLERNEDVGSYFFSIFGELIARGKTIRLLYFTGSSDNNGFFSELSNRIVVKMLPPPLIERDLAEVCRILFNNPQDIIWFEQHAFSIADTFMNVARKYHVDFSHLMHDLEDALIILGSHVSSLGVSREIRRHIDHSELSDSSFVKLSMAINRWDTPDKILAELTQCRKNILQVRHNLENSGVSVHLIYMIEKVVSYLNRIEYLLHLRYNTVNSALILKFISKLLSDEQENLGVSNFIQHNIHLLTRKIVERSGDKGHHYIADSAKEKRQLFVAASWAGVLTAFTAIIKYWIGAGNFPYFFEGFFFFVNYAVSFLLMQYWHLALSSKQPAYTASALSRKFEDFKITRELTEIILEVKKISHSQFLAFIGNLLWVVPLVYVFDLIHKFSFGSSIMNERDAYLAINKHGLFNSLTLVHAAFTGVLLWFSSVVSGWTENWIVYRNIPILIEQSRAFNLIFGKNKTHSIAETLPGILSGVAGCLAIALFLSAPIIIGKIFGLPLDIRHVTLAAGTVTLAISSISPGLDQWYIYLEMLLSITVIGILNFGVSFYCAIRMAALARDVHPKYLKKIFKFALTRKKFKKLDTIQESE